MRLTRKFTASYSSSHLRISFVLFSLFIAHSALASYDSLLSEIAKKHRYEFTSEKVFHGEGWNKILTEARIE